MKAKPDPTLPTLYKRKKTGRKVPCTGEAHTNPHIDHCMVCLGGKFGLLDELEPVDLTEAREKGMDVAACDLSEEQFLPLYKSRAVPLVDRREGASFFMVFRFKEAKR